jgi:hypothetical protein
VGYGVLNPTFSNLAFYCHSVTTFAKFSAKWLRRTLELVPALVLGVNTCTRG